MARPNAVLLVADQQEATSLLLYGNNRPVRAPHLEAPATRGVVVEQGRVQRPF